MKRKFVSRLIQDLRVGLDRGVVLYGLRCFCYFVCSKKSCRVKTLPKILPGSLTASQSVPPKLGYCFFAYPTNLPRPDITEVPFQVLYGQVFDSAPNVPRPIKKWSANTHKLKHITTKGLLMEAMVVAPLTKKDEAYLVTPDILAPKI